MKQLFVVGLLTGVALLFPKLSTASTAQLRVEPTREVNQVTPVREAVQQRQQNQRKLQQDRVESAQERQSTAENNKQERMNDRCELLSARIDNWIARYTARFSRLESLKEKASELIRTTIARANSAGKDTSVLESKSAIFDQKAIIAMAEYRIFLDKLQTLSTLSCEEDTSAYRLALVEAQSQMQTVRRAVLDVRLYYQQEIKPAMRELLS